MKKIKREQVLYMVYNEDNEEGFWETYDSLAGAQLSNPDGAIIYSANLKPVGKTKSMLTEIKRSEIRW